MGTIQLLYVILCGLHCFCVGIQFNPPQDAIHMVEDATLQRRNEDLCITDPDTFICQWFTQSGDIVTSAERPGDEYIQVAGTTNLDPAFHTAGTQIMIDAFSNMPRDVFLAFAVTARVGLFTEEDKTTIFPEYEYYRDRPECEGTCAGACSNTCTGDGRKYDSLAGLGGIRATCLDDNYMCTSDDPYGNMYSVLIHEAAHTVHQYALSETWQDAIDDAYINAYNNEIWDIESYGMSNALEYFAEGAGVFFNVNFHGSSSGGMNGCGRGPGEFCESEEEARQWLASQDNNLYNALLYVFTDNTGVAGEMDVCPAL